MGLEGTAVRVGGLDADAVDVRQGEFADVARGVGASCGLGAEAVRHGFDAGFP